jgi:hypothetical protein
VRLENLAQAWADRLQALADWLTDSTLAKNPPPPLPDFRTIDAVLHGGPRDGLCLPVDARAREVQVVAPVDVVARFLEDGEPPEAPTFARYVYRRQTYEQVVDGVRRRVFLSDGVKHG